MTVPVERINRERLNEWRKLLDDHHATALMLVGVGHDEVSGNIRVCIPENIDERQVAAILRGIAADLEKGGKS